MKKFIWIILTIISLPSCEKIIPFENEIGSPKIVVNSIFSTDSMWKIHLSYSKSVIDSSEFNNIDNAEIKIVDSNDNLITNFHYIKNGFYESNLFPKTNKKYFLNVISENYMLKSFDKVPKETIITSVDTLSFIQDGKERIKISLAFVDPENENNYYKLAVKTKKTLINYDHENNYLDSSVKENWIKLFKESDILEKTIENSELIFNDLTFNGENFSIEFSIKDLIKKFNRDDSVLLNSINIYFFSISECMYNYHKSIQMYNNTNEIPLIQPVQVFSNIENGYGIFAGANPNIINIYD